ncbi:DUF3137 domain-containing protein [bacterium]|nr:DUF3137 domain-containing protein [bacterium]
MGILQSIFGPSKDEIWSQLANDMGGLYKKGGFFGTDVLRYRSGEWEVTLDTYTTGKNNTVYTRMRAPFVNKDGLYFRIYRQGFFATIGKAFGMQDIEIGDPYFDDEFIIKGNSEQKIQMLLADPELKDRIRRQPDICLQVKNDEGWFGAKFPSGVDELYFQCYGVLKDKELLKNLFEMFCITLQRLVQIDSAYENDPNVRL